MADSRKILAFDIGIRNLAWCFMDRSTEKPTIVGWQNYDLLRGEGAEVARVKITCSKCSVTAAFTNPTADSPTCSRHCPASHPILKDLSGAVLKKLPALKALRALVPAVRSATKAKLVEALRAKVSLPIEKVKVTKALDTELTTLHDSIRTFVGANLTLFRQATHILLENQPVLKNPTMKSVQILLFATLRDMLQPDPPVLKLVHAGKKITGMETGDAGYKSRKDASEAKVVEWLEKGKIAGATPWLALFKSHTKKSDLADAFCMCLA